MSLANLRLVYDADEPAPAPRHPPLCLTSTRHLESWLRKSLREGRDGEVLLQGAGTARICLFEGRVAWIQLSGYPEHLGHVMRRELGMTGAALRQAMTHCRDTGRRFGEGLVALGLLESAELRDCMYRHMSDQLWEIMAWSGSLTVEHSDWPHRYDRAYTFELDELLAQPSHPSAEERRQLTAVIERCQEQLPLLQVACVIEAEEGTVLHTGIGPEQSQHEAEDMLSLCIAGLRRLATNRLTGRDGAPEGMVVGTKNGCLVVQALAWRPGWLLVLGGREQSGRVLAVAGTVAASAP